MKVLYSLFKKEYKLISYLNQQLAFYSSNVPSKDYKPKKHFQKSPVDFSNLTQNELKGEILYGIHPIKAALVAGKREFYKLYISQSVFNSTKEEIHKLIAVVESLGLEVSIQKKFLLNQLSAGRPHQGLCMDASALLPTPLKTEELLGSCGGDRRWLILDSIQDPMNFGSILRTSHYFGFNKIFINTSNNCSLTSTVSKASSGAMEFAEVFAVQNMSEFVTALKDRDWLVIASSVSKGKSDLEVQEAASFKDKKVAIVLGNEGVGIDKCLEKVCSAHMHIRQSSYSSSSMSPPSSSLLKSSPPPPLSSSPPPLSSSPPPLSSSPPPLSSSPPPLSSSTPPTISFHLDSLNVNVVTGIILNAFSISTNK